MHTPIHTLFKPSYLALALLIGVSATQTSQAQDAATQQVRSFQVPAGPLDQVLLGISRQSGQLISLDPRWSKGDRQMPSMANSASIKLLHKRYMEAAWASPGMPMR